MYLWDVCNLYFILDTADVRKHRLFSALSFLPTGALIQGRQSRRGAHGRPHVPPAWAQQHPRLRQTQPRFRGDPGEDWLIDWLPFLSPRPRNPEHLTHVRTLISRFFCFYCLRCTLCFSLLGYQCFFLRYFIPLQSYWSLSCDHGLDYLDYNMAMSWQQQQQR